MLLMKTELYNNISRSPGNTENNPHLSVSFIFLAIMVRNSGKSMVPFPSASTSLIMSWSSASVGFWPRDLITCKQTVVSPEARRY